MDYNVYDAPPIYDFGGYLHTQTTYSLSQFQAQGFETHATGGVNKTNLFFDQVSYVVKAPYTTAGQLW